MPAPSATKDKPKPEPETIPPITPPTSFSMSQTTSLASSCTNVVPESKPEPASISSIIPTSLSLSLSPTFASCSNIVPELEPMSSPTSLPSYLPMLCPLSLTVSAASSCKTDIVPISDPESTPSVTPSLPVFPSPSLSTSDRLHSHSLSHSELQRTPEPLVVTEEDSEFEPDLACVHSFPSMSSELSFPLLPFVPY
jgi:hypothetical protein